MRPIRSLRRRVSSLFARRANVKNAKRTDLRSLQRRVAELERELHSGTERLDFLVNFMRDLSLELDPLLNSILRDMAEVLPAADMGAIFLLDADAHVLRIRASYGYADEESLSRIVLKPGDSLSGKVFVSGQPLLVRSQQEIIAEVENVGSEHDELYSRATRGAVGESIMSAPLRTSTGGIIGTIAMTSTRTSFDDNDLALLEGVGGQIAQAVANAQLFSDLASSEDRYRHLVEDISLGVTESTTSGEIRYFNSRACEILGVDPSELPNLRGEDFWSNPRDRHALLSNIELNDFHRFEVQVRRRDGRMIWIAGSVRATRDEEGDVIRTNSIFDDVTQRHQREARTAALNRVREKVWRMSTEEDIESVLIAVRDGLKRMEIPYLRCGIVVVEGASDTTSIRVHDLDSTDDSTIRHRRPVDQDRQAASTVFDFWRAGEPVYRRDLDVEDPYGERQRVGSDVRCLLDVPFSHGTLSVKSDTPNSYSEEDIQLLQDLADVLSDGFNRMDDLQRLSEERERLAVTLRSIGDGVITTDADRKILMTNGVAEDLTGWTQKDAAGLILSEVYSTKDEDTYRTPEDAFTKVMESGIAVSRPKLVLLAKDGAERIVSDSSAPIRDREGKILGMVIVFRDVTDQRRREAESQRSEKIESLGVLAGGIAHDFNNILTAIIGNISLAKLDLDPGDRLYESLTQVEDASQQAAALTHQLLTFSKGGAPIKRLASISELIQDSAKFALRGSNVRCEFDIDDDLWPAEVDSGQMSQVIHNLVINANQAMPEGGVIDIRIANREVTDRDSFPLNAGQYTLISVTDEGVGIAMNHLQKIFEPYFSTKQQGSGLGLATVHSIVTNHGGQISVRSQLGLGTTFAIHIPASATATVLHKEQELSLLKGEGRVLVMDDDESIRQSIGKMLRRLGYEPAFAEDGDEALELYREARERDCPFAAVIADLTIPGGMGGKELIVELQRLDPEVRAIVSSGYSRDPVMAHASRFGFTGVMAKPYSLTELGRILHEVLSETRPRLPLN